MSQNNKQASAGFSHEKIETNNFLMIVLILLVIGVSLGVRFRAEFLHTAPRWLASVAVGTFGLMGICAAFAAVLAWATGLPWVTLLLGTSPGGITEMAITHGQAQVEHRRVVALGRACKGGGGPIVLHIHRKPGAFQRCAQLRGQGGVVFNDQDTHSGLLSSCSGAVQADGFSLRAFATAAPA